MLGTIFGPTREEVTGKWSRLCNEELSDLQSSSNTIWVIKLRRTWAGHVAHIGERKRACRVLVNNPEGNSRLGRARRGWQDNIEMGLKEVNEGHGLDSPESRKEQAAGSCECGTNLWVP